MYMGFAALGVVGIGRRKESPTGGHRVRSVDECELIYSISIED